MVKRELTKTILCNSFKSLMHTTSFDKITIRMITDKAGVIRPTFYNYFRDKYEVLEYIFDSEIVSLISEMIDDGMKEEAIRFLFKKIEQDRKFYKKAFKIKGQNSFEEIVIKHIYELYLSNIKKNNLNKINKVKYLSEEIIAKYYAMGTVNVLKTWLLENEDNGFSADDITQIHDYLITHTIFDVME